MEATKQQLLEKLGEVTSSYQEAKAMGKIQEVITSKEDVAKAVRGLQETFIRKSKELNNQENRI
jgi:hydroxymethylpyrimidine/phosphomethylpyrimidine kinase